MTLVRLFIYCLILVPMSGSNVSNVFDKSTRRLIDVREQVSFTGGHCPTRALHQLQIHK